MIGVVIDIGSASVGAALVDCRTENAPEMLWQTRTFVPFAEKVSHTETLENLCRAIKLAVQGVVSEGTKALATRYPRVHVDHVYAAIAAPWSYTTTQTVSITRDAPFVLTEATLEELERTAAQQAKEVLATHDNTQQLTRLATTLDTVTANGYPVAHALGVRAQQVNATITTELVHRAIYDALSDALDRAYPSAERTFTTFMRTFAAARKTFASNTSSLLVLDVSSEATEVGLVRDDKLTTVTYSPYGIYTLARAIADTCSVPLSEALAFIRDEDDDVLDTKKQQAALADVTSMYETNVVELLERVTARAALPHTVLLHTDIRTERFFTQHIQRAFKEVTGSAARIQPVTSKFFSAIEDDDAALLLIAQRLTARLHR